MNDNNPIIIKRKKVRAAVHHGGSWKVAYADFVTAMMAFFMVMWIMGMSQETRSMVAGYFNDPLGFMKNQPKSKSPFAVPGSPVQKSAVAQKGPNSKRSADEELELKRIEGEFKAAMKADVDLKALAQHVEIVLEDEGLRIELVETTGAVFFESGQAVIRPEAKRLISKIGPILGRSTRPIIIEGHTDAAPYPSVNYDNWNLSSDRANTVRRCMSASGVNAKQFVEIRGYADTRLKNRKDPFHFSNRRVTVLLPFKQAENIPDNLPGEKLKREIQGVFQKPLDIAPPRAQPEQQGESF